MDTRSLSVLLAVGLSSSAVSVGQGQEAESPSWRERATALELEGQTDAAALARIRGLVDEDDVQERREIARLVEDRQQVRWTRRIPSEGEWNENLGVSAAAGRVAAAIGAVHVWDELTGELVAGPLGEDAYDVALDPSGRLVAVARLDGALELWSVESGTLEARLGQKYGDMTWSSDGRLFAASLWKDQACRLAVWHAETAEVLFESEPQQNPLDSFALSARGWLAVPGQDEERPEARIYDVSDGSVIATIRVGFDGPVRFHPTQPWLVFVDSSDTSLRVFDVERRSLLESRIVGLRRAEHLECDPTGTLWVLARRSDAVASRLDGTPAGLPFAMDDLEDWNRSKYGMEASALSQDAELHACTGIGDTVRLWSTRSGLRLEPTLRHGAPVESMAFTSAGSLVTASADGVVRLWSTESMQPVETSCDPRSATAHLSRRGSRALVVRSVGSLELLDSSGEVLSQVPTPVCFHGLTTSRDGQRYAASGAGFGAWTGTLVDGVEAPELVSRAQRQWSVALDATGTRLVEQDFDVIRVWETATGDLLEQYPTEPIDERYGLAFDAGGELLALDIAGLGRTRPGPPRLATGPAWNAVESDAIAVDTLGASYLSATEEETEVTWRCGDDAAEGLERWVEAAGIERVLSWHCSDQRVIVVHRDGALLLDPRSDAPVQEWISPAPGEVRRASLVGDRLLVVHSSALALVDATDGVLLAWIEHGRDLRSATPIPGTNRILASFREHTSEVRDVVTGERVGEASTEAWPPFCVEVGDAGLAHVATDAGAVLEVDLERGTRREIRAASGARVIHLLPPQDARRAVWVEHPDVLVLRDTEAGRDLYRRELAPEVEKPLLFTSEHSPAPEAIRFDPSGSRLLVAALIHYRADGGYMWGNVQPEIVDVETGQVAVSLSSDDGAIEHVEFNADGSLLLEWRFKRVNVWDARTGEALPRVEVDEWLESAQFVENGETLCTVDRRGGWALWESRTGRLVHQVEAAEGVHFKSSSLGPDGRWLVMERPGRGSDWIDLRDPTATDPLVLPGFARFGANGTVLIGSRWFGRRTRDSIVGLAWRTPTWSADGRYDIWDSGSLSLIDAARVCDGARAVLGGIEFDVMDFGPSQRPPVLGSPRELEAKWSERLGWAIDGEGSLGSR